MSAPRSSFLIPTLSGANFAIGVGGFVTVGVLSPMAEGLAMTKAEAGLTLTIYAVAYAIGSPLAVALTGAWSRRLVLAGGMALFALANAATALAPGPEVLFVSRALAALGAGVVTPVVAGVAVANSPEAARGRALSLTFFGLTAAQVIGVPAGAWLGYALGWRAAFWASAGLALIAAGGIAAYVPAATAFQVNSLRTLGAGLKDFRVNFAILTTTMLLSAVYILYTYLAPVLEAGMGFGGTGVSLFLMVCGLGGMAGNLLSGPATDRFGPFAVLVAIALAQAAFLPVFSLLPVNAALLMLVGFFWSVMGWSFIVPQQTRLMAIAPERQAVTLALNAAALYVGVALGSWLGGLAIEAWGLGALGYAAGAAALAALAQLALSERWTKGET